MDYPCRMLQQTDRFKRSLRRFTYSAKACPANTYGHNASVDIGVIEMPDFEWAGRGTLPGMDGAPDKDHSEWPAKCFGCDYVFLDTDEWQVNDERMYTYAGSMGPNTRGMTIEECTMHESPVGSMWFAPWYDSHLNPQLEHALVVVLPGHHEWVVDSQASNCTMKDDHAQEKHHCWIITGTLPNITVGKDGPTCAAGAGSIQITGWHGFLRNGVLVEC